MRVELNEAIWLTEDILKCLKWFVAIHLHDIVMEKSFDEHLKSLGDIFEDLVIINLEAYEDNIITYNLLANSYQLEWVNKFSVIICLCKLIFIQFSISFKGMVYRHLC